MEKVDGCEDTTPNIYRQNRSKKYQLWFMIGSVWVWGLTYAVGTYYTYNVTRLPYISISLLYFPSGLFVYHTRHDFGPIIGSMGWLGVTSVSSSEISIPTAWRANLLLTHITPQPTNGHVWLEAHLLSVHRKVNIMTNFKQNCLDWYH
jgi:integral membrane sensor domain MASE1